MHKRRIMSMAVGFVLLIVAVFLAAELYDHGTVTGEVFYPETEVLPHGARLVVVLSDVSNEYGSPVASVARSIENERPPLSFELLYRESAIMDGRSYSISARIETNYRELLLVSTESLPVPKAGAPLSFTLIPVN